MSHEKFRSCIQACYDCAAACDHCATACLKEDDVKMMSRCIELDLYCAEICRVAAGFMAKGEMFAKEVCALCARICEECGKECGKHKHGHCQECAAMCKKCAEACRRMAA